MYKLASWIWSCPAQGDAQVQLSGSMRSAGNCTQGCLPNTRGFMTGSCKFPLKSCERLNGWCIHPLTVAELRLVASADLQWQAPSPQRTKKLWLSMRRFSAVTTFYRKKRPCNLRTNQSNQRTSERHDNPTQDSQHTMKGQKPALRVHTYTAHTINCYQYC